MKQIKIHNLTRTRIPTESGDFQLCYYQNNLDNKEHLALVYGNIAQQKNVLVRIHSECFTGDVLGSLRCDCGPQLQGAMKMIAQAGAGVIVYLRQEGRGIGLLAKMRAYNLQDMGYDTVDANLLLGHQADERDYSLGAQILKDLGVTSIQLLTNNPEKIEGLEELGIVVENRVPLITDVHAENAGYLQTKVERMRHLMNLEDKLNGYAKAPMPLDQNNGRISHTGPTAHSAPTSVNKNYPQITLTYAQSLDGSITLKRGQPLAISGKESMTLTHRLRATHDAILIGVGTLLADNPSLTVRHVKGDDPQPVILDSHLRTPPDARVIGLSSHKLLLFCKQDAAVDKMAALEQAGARVFPIRAADNGRLNLPDVLTTLKKEGINSVMVEGGSEVITSFLASRLVDRVILTIAPMFVGGLTAVHNLNTNTLPKLRNIQQEWLGKDLIIQGDAYWEDEIES
ncbi:MAG: GTP cyclohydrolase II [Chloroflexota bacterium]